MLDMVALLGTFEAAHGPIGVGEQMRTDHPDCGDTRRRLYIKRKTDGVVGYCHNCGQSGWYRGGVPHIAASTAPPRHPNIELVPADVEYGRLPAEAATWVQRYGINAAQWVIGWSEDYQRIVLPVCNAGMLRGCQLRRVGNYGPKYISMRGPEELEGLYLHAIPKPIVITEDLLSAWRCFDAGFGAIPLLGYHMRPERIPPLLASNHREFLVWLDDDKPEIQAAQHHLCRMIVALGGKAYQLRGWKEPKLHSDHVLSDILKHATENLR
jgi:hypothetical protein